MKQVIKYNKIKLTTPAGRRLTLAGGYLQAWQPDFKFSFLTTQRCCLQMLPSIIEAYDNAKADCFIQ